MAASACRQPGPGDPQRQRQERAPPGQLGGRLVHLGGDLTGVHLERAQEPPQHLQGLERRNPVGGALQIDVQLPVGEPPSEPVRRADSQGGLRRIATPSHATLLAG